MEKDWETLQDAIGAVRFYRRHFASGPEFQKRLQDILAQLRQADENNGVRGLLWHVAEGIEKGLSGGPHREVPK
jgi:hypothetical protein